LLIFLGLVSLAQITFLPGFICLRAFRLPTRGLLQPVVYSFALSLLVNYLVVYSLHAAHLYSAPVLYLLILLECVALFRLPAGDGSLTVPSEETLARYKSPQMLLAAIPAFAAILALVWLCYTNFGSVYLIGDDVVSWDRWAIEWAEDRIQYSTTGYYPQLLPTNLSVPYVLMQNIDLKLFGKAIMPLFSLFTALLFLDLFHKTGDTGWLFGLPAYALLLRYFFKPEFITSGYTEMANAFLAFLTLHACLEVSWSPPDGVKRALVLVAVFASATVLVKQGGVYIFVWAMVWLAAQFIRRAKTISWRLPVFTLALVLYLNWWYVVKHWEVRHRADFSNLTYLTQDIHAGKSYPQRWSAAYDKLEKINGPSLTPLFQVLCGLLPLALFHRRGRFVLLTITAPFYVLWALLFSYEPRTLAMDLPFAGYCCGCGLAVALESFRRAREPKGPRWVRVAGVGGILAVGILVAFPGRHALGGLLLERNFGLMLVNSLIAGGVALLILILLRRYWPLHVSISRPVIFVFLLAITLPALTVNPDPLIRDQLEKRKQVGYPALNRRLYEFLAAGPLEGKIMTNYWFLDFVPELRIHSRTLVIPSTLDLNSLQRMADETGTGYILTNSDRFPPELRRQMKQSGYKFIFEEIGYQLVRFPHRSTSSFAASTITPKPSSIP
jgi:hypothetical protein